MGRSGSRTWAGVAVAGSVLASACAPVIDSQSALDTRGPAAGDIAALWWVLLWAATAVLVITMGFLWVAVRRRGRPGSRFILVWGVALPAVVLLVLMGLTIQTGAQVYRPSTQSDMTVEVIGHQFWWEVRYDDGTTVTANEIHIPVGEPVRLLLRSADVIHSFWVPQLHGKMDLVPGRTNEFWIQADEPGEYRGACAEYCGIQHAKMLMLVIAEPRAEFDDWLALQRADAAEPAGELAAAGQEVFLGTSCVQCHVIRGVTPPLVAGDDVVVGPDLTHLANRRTIAAGVLPNTRGWLGGWVLDPQSHKPGVRMPPTDLNGPQLQALLDYLEGLE